MFQGALARLTPNRQDPYFPLATEHNDNRVQLDFVGLQHDVDGKVWTKNVGTEDLYGLI